MPSKPADESANKRYDEIEKHGYDKRNIPTVERTVQPVVEQPRARVVPDTELTLEVQYVSGPEAESLALTQYTAIREVLQWLSNQQQAA